MGYLNALNPSSGAYVGPTVNANQVWQTVRSDILDFSATGTIEAVSIPAGALVKEVLVLLTAALTANATPDVDIGDGVNPDRYMDGIGALATDTVLIAPYPYSTTSASDTDFTAHDENAAYHYESADTIDVLVNATSTTGSGRVIVTYLVDADWS